jgi:hypothetical protein
MYPFYLYPARYHIQFFFYTIHGKNLLSGKDLILIVLSTWHGKTHPAGIKTNTALIKV